jgi:hypothetical protein
MGSAGGAVAIMKAKNQMATGLHQPDLRDRIKHRCAGRAATRSQACTVNDLLVSETQRQSVDAEKRMLRHRRCISRVQFRE